MSDGGPLIRGDIRRLWEALFSLHLGLLGVSMALIASRTTAALFTHMEIRINRSLHIQQTDFIRGHFETWIPSVLAAFLVLLILRTCARARFTQEFLRSVAGIITIFAPLAFWLFVYEQGSWSLVWPYNGAPIEVVTALACTLLFLSGRWKTPFWVGVLLLAAHYIFWYFAGESNPYFSNYAGLAGPILGFCSAVAWGLYVSRKRKVEAVGTPVVS
jgi:hypothetical protein